MKNSTVNIAKLIIKKFRGHLTQDEGNVLSNWRDGDLRNKLFLEDLEQKSAEGIDSSILNKFDESAAWELVLRKQQRGTTLFMWRSIAAVLAVLVSITIYFVTYQFDNGSDRIVSSKDAKYKNDVLPAILGAKVIRADGSEIKVADNILFSVDGHMSNSSSETMINEEELLTKLNTLVVPAANYINLTLADGTKVWVNANSRLNFPSKFVGKERRVVLEGEAYFEVAKDASRPFYVESKGAEIKVLGTHFNVMAYSNQLITTLVEGSVKVSKGNKSMMLLPGERADIDGSFIDKKPADFQKELAWKNNIFYFKGDNIVRIAQELQSWYGLEVSFSNDISLLQTYTGEIRRDANLSEVLNMLEFVSDLEFKIDINKLLISKRKI